jgi:hypothetical protein
MTYRHTRRMVRMFIGQLMLIAILFAFDDRLPPRILRMMVFAAAILPLVAYLTIIVQPPVYHAWQSLLRELYHAGVSFIATLWSWFSIKTVVRFCQFVINLRTFPSTPDAWVALVLFPFKVFVLMAIPFLWGYCSLMRWVEPRSAYLRFREATFAISGVYILCLGILLLGALVQALFCHRGRSTQTVCVFVVGFILMWML